MNKYNGYPGWDDYSDEFRDMNLDTFHYESLSNPNAYTHSDAIDYMYNLLKNTDLEKPSKHIIHLYSKYVWRFFSYSMLPLEVFEEEWKKNILKIQYILIREKSLLAMCKNSRTEGFFHKDLEKDYDLEPNSLEVFQDISMFLCINSLYSNNDKEFERYLKQCIKYTISNLSFAFDNGINERFTEDKSYDKDFYIPREAYWQEPAVWLLNEILYLERKDLAFLSHRQYLSKLKKLKSQYKNNRIIDTIIKNISSSKNKLSNMHYK